MLKIIPLVILPIYFLLFFLNVENLTEDLDRKNDFSEDENVTLSVVKLEDKEIAGEIVTEKEQINEEAVQAKEQINDEGKTKKDVPDKSNIFKNNNVENGKGKKTKGFYIQFGAFSKKNNAVQLRKKIEKVIKEQYPSTKFSILNDGEKNLFKLIILSDLKELAENVCNYSKKKKISCLVVKE